MALGLGLARSRSSGTVDVDLPLVHPPHCPASNSQDLWITRSIRSTSTGQIVGNLSLLSCSSACAPSNVQDLSVKCGVGEQRGSSIDVLTAGQVAVGASSFLDDGDECCDVPGSGAE